MSRHHHHWSPKLRQFEVKVVFLYDSKFIKRVREKEATIDGARNDIYVITEGSETRASWDDD